MTKSGSGSDPDVKASHMEHILHKFLLRSSKRMEICASNRGLRARIRSTKAVGLGAQTLGVFMCSRPANMFGKTVLIMSQTNNRSNWREVTGSKLSFAIERAMCNTDARFEILISHLRLGLACKGTTRLRSQSSMHTEMTSATCSEVNGRYIYLQTCSCCNSTCRTRVGTSQCCDQ